MNRKCGHQRSVESGYAYIMAFFLITAMLIGSEAVLRNLAVEAKREREAEMIWRGNQYVRAIRLYYRKTGHYPSSIDDLAKGVPDLHFLRPVILKEPLNRADGSWRLIYTNATGQIIGSVRYATMQQMALMDLNGGKLPTPTAGVTSGASAAPNTATGATPTSTPTTDTPSQGQPPAQTNTNSPFGAPPTTAGANGQAMGLLGGLNQGANLSPSLEPTGPVDGPVFGAFLAGVAGGNHYDGTSVKVYKGGKTYQQWEFIWNPLEDQARALQNGLAPQPGLGQQPGLPIANPNGGAPTPALNPPSGAPAPPPAQPQQPPEQ